MGIAPARVGAILLAAGHSHRFGPADKLLHPFHGEPLALHAARTLGAAGFGQCVAVAGAAVAAILPPAFRCIANPAPEHGLSSSISIGVAAITDAPIDACLIALADMPLVPADHIARLLDAFDADDPLAMIATCAPGGKAMVPAIFGRGCFRDLAGLVGDRGARDLLSGAPTICCDEAYLADFDREADFGT